MKARGGIEHTTVSTKSVISTKPCIYYGCNVVSITTGGVRVAIYDATDTAQGTLVDVVSVVAGTYNNDGVFYSPGIIMHSGIYASALVCTTAGDSIVVFHGGL